MLKPSRTPLIRGGGSGGGVLRMPIAPLNSAASSGGRTMKRSRRPTAQSLPFDNVDNSTDTLTPYQGKPLPIKMNNIPHTREMRRHFYSEISTAVTTALAAGELRLNVRCTIPELNTEFDVYRVGTLLELVREMATAIANDGKKVKVCVQQALGEGIFKGTPISLSGVMRILKAMDWGAAGEFISLGNLGAAEVQDGGADVFILISPQNITGHSVLPLLSEMTTAAAVAGKPIILVNAKLVDVPSSGGIMGVRGRQERQDYVASYVPAYHFRLLYLGAGPYPIMGALRYTYSGPWEVLKRVDFMEESGKRGEAYHLAGQFPDGQPNAQAITACFQKKK